jgi:hypothetical protein
MRTSRRKAEQDLDWINGGDDDDIALAGEEIFAAVTKLGIVLRSSETRTGELTNDQIDALNLRELADTARRLTGVEARFMVFASSEAAANRGSSIPLVER